MVYIACEELNFTWKESQIEEVIALWNAGIPIQDMSKQLNRKQEEVTILIMDLAMCRRVKAREGGLLGCIS